MAKLMLAVSMLVGAGACTPPQSAERSGPVESPIPTTGPEPTSTTEATTTTTPEPTTTTTEVAESVEEAPTTVPTTRARSAPITTVYVDPEPAPVARGGGAPLACIRSYEQGKDGYATDTGNGFYGAYQFDLPTWRSVGGSGNPAHASPAEQDMRAQMLYDSRGLQPWPTPAVMCA